MPPELCIPALVFYSMILVSALLLAGFSLFVWRNFDANWKYTLSLACIVLMCVLRLVFFSIGLIGFSNLTGSFYSDLSL